jgi:hypothetical protein
VPQVFSLYYDHHTTTTTAIMSGLPPRPPGLPARPTFGLASTIAMRGANPAPPGPVQAAATEALAAANDDPASESLGKNKRYGGERGEAARIKREEKLAAICDYSRRIYLSHIS